jgi:hypothetical protein
MLAMHRYISMGKIETNINADIHRNLVPVKGDTTNQ